MADNLPVSRHHKLDFLIGLLTVVLLYHAAFLRGTELKAIVHDEFDGEVLTYILQAKHLSGGSLPELFNGTAITAMMPPAPLFVLFYALLKPELAFFFCYVLILFLAYTGMYLCILQRFEEPVLAAAIGSLFTLLPFYSVYGLSVMGQPLLFYGFGRLWKEEREDLMGILLIIFFALSSSLVLVGFADCIILLLFAVFDEKKGQKLKPLLIAWSALVLVYAACNVKLLASVVDGADGFVSHRTEFVAAPISFISAFRSLFIYGQHHAASYHRFVIPWILVVLIWSWFCKCHGKLKRKELQLLKEMTWLLVAAVSIALFYALWHCPAIVRMRYQLGGVFVVFQVDRFYWMYPAIWFILFAYSLHFAEFNFTLIEKRKLGKLIIGMTLVCIGAYLFLRSTAFVNARALYAEEEHTDGYASIDEFFQPTLFKEIAEYIGETQENYRVVSVGLYPSIPLYNGFYCLDGYSNNYDLTYKHQFRVVISGELEKDESLRSYYDDWGNRCYVFSSEIPKRYYISKTENVTIKALALDYGKLYEMGCRYVLSGVPITDEHLVFLKEFDTPDSYYRILLYRVEV